MMIFWLIIFIISLAVLVKGADWLIAGAEQIGLAAGLSPFVVGATIVGIGTSLPELISSFVAVHQGVSDVVVANAVGSNIANILLVIGLSVVIGRRLSVTKNLIDIDLPLLALSAVLLLVVSYDKQVTFGEAALLLISYSVYILYTLFHKDQDEIERAANLVTHEDEFLDHTQQTSARHQVKPKHIMLLVVGVIALSAGANYLVASIIKLSAIFNIATGIIAITAVALGTSLPELLVSIKAAIQNKSEVALGNVLGSNIFNSLALVGLPGIFGRLTIDDKTFSLGIPMMIIATLILVISGISKRIYMWEGALYVVLYILFTAKLFAWF